MAAIEGKDLVEIVGKVAENPRIDDLRGDMNTRFNIVFGALALIITAMVSGFLFLLEKLP